LNCSEFFAGGDFTGEPELAEVFASDNPGPGIGLSLWMKTAGPKSRFHFGGHATVTQPQPKPPAGGVGQPPPTDAGPEANTETARAACLPQAGQFIAGTACDWIFSTVSPQAGQRYS